MSQAIAGPTAPAPSVLPGVALVRGKIVGKPRKYQDRDGAKRCATLVRLPAADEWSSASTIEVQSTEPLGDVGDTFAGRVRISGTAKPFQYTDRTSGEVKSGTDCTIRLSLVE